jgi:hypothetical protein
VSGEEVEVVTRKCGCCDEDLPLSAFYKDGEDAHGETKYRRDCKECYKATRISELAAKKRKAKEDRRNG